VSTDPIFQPAYPVKEYIGLNTGLFEQQF